MSDETDYDAIAESEYREYLERCSFESLLEELGELYFDQANPVFLIKDLTALVEKYSNYEEPES